MVHDSPDRLAVAFDDERVVANAGVLLPAVLADRLGIEALVDRTVDLGDRSGAANPGRKVMTLVSAMALGADCIDDCGVLRSGQTRAVLGHDVAAPSTLGTFLRAFTFGSVLITAVALIFGLRVRPANFVLALIVLAMMVLLGVSIAYALALAVPNESVLPTLMNGLAQPLSLLAGVLIPLSVAPLWIKDVALWNPFAWAAKGMGALFQDHIGASVVWAWVRCPPRCPSRAGARCRSARGCR